MCGLNTVQKLLQESEAQLKDMFNVQHCRICVIEEDGQSMYRYEKGVKIESGIHLGLLGEAIEKMKITNTFSPY